MLVGPLILAFLSELGRRIEQASREKREVVSSPDSVSGHSKRKLCLSDGHSRGQQ